MTISQTHKGDLHAGPKNYLYNIFACIQNYCNFSILDSLYILLFFQKSLIQASRSNFSFFFFMLCHSSPTLQRVSIKLSFYHHLYKCLHSCSVTQLCPTLYDPVNYSLPVSSVHAVLQARTLKWAAISSSGGPSQTRGQAHVSCVSCISR